MAAAFRAICRSPNSTTCITGNANCSRNPRTLPWRLVLQRNLTPASACLVSDLMGSRGYSAVRGADVALRPGWNRYSVGYFSSDGFKSHSYPFTSTSYGPPLTEGDVLGVGYRPRTGTVFFTRNGKKLEDAYIGLNRHNLFPTVGANAACILHVNFGQAGFVFIEANVKKWGLAPMMGTLAPPPAYGSERGSILLQAAGSHNADSSASSSHSNSHHRSTTASTRTRAGSRRSQGASISTSTPVPTSAAGAASALGFSSPNQPIRPSPLRHSRQLSNLSSRSSDRGSGTGTGSAVSANEDSDLQNPPTPGLLDISLHSMHRFPVSEQHEEESEEENDRCRRGGSEDEQDSQQDSQQSDSENDSDPHETSSVPSGSRLEHAVSVSQQRDVSPPAYHPIDPHVSPLSRPRHESRYRLWRFVSV